MEKKTILIWAVFIALASAVLSYLYSFIQSFVGYFNAKAQSFGYYSYNSGFFGLMKVLDTLALLAVVAIIVFGLFILLAEKSEKANKKFAFSIIGCFALLVVITIIARLNVPIDVASNTQAIKWNSTDAALYTTLRNFVLSMFFYLGIFSAIVIVPLFWKKDKNVKSKPAPAKNA